MERTRLEETADNIFFEKGSSEGDLVVWPEYEDEPNRITFRVRGWAPDGKSVRTLYSDTRNWKYHETCAVVVSPTHFVGYAGSCQDSPGIAQLWKADRVGNELSNEELSPNLPDRSQVFRHMSTWGDHVSLWTGRKLFVIRLSDWKVRQIPIPEGLAHPTTTLSDDHLYVAYQTEDLILSPPFPVTLNLTNEVYRYDLSQFETLGVEPE